MIAIDQQTHDQAHAAQAGTTDLWRFPPLKFPPLTEWQEEDGAEADLTAPRLDVKSGTLTLHATTEEQAQAIISQLQQPRARKSAPLCCPRVAPRRSVHPPRGETRKAQPTVAHPLCGLCAVPTPTPQPRCHPRGGRSAAQRGFQNGRQTFQRLWSACARGQHGSFESVEAPRVAYSQAPTTGQLADLYAPTRRKPREVTVHLLWRASSLQQLHTNREAFLARLTLPETRQIDVEATGKRYAAIYKSEIVNDFYPQDAWLESSITFTIINEQEL